MATPETVIASVQSRLDALMGVSIPYGIGEKERQKHRSPPAVCWVDRDSEIKPIKRAGGNPTPIYIEVTRWQVIVWHDSRANMRALWTNLLVAARREGCAIRWGRYAVTTEQNLDKGSALVAEAEIHLDVLDAPIPTVAIDDINVGGYVDGTLVSETTQIMTP
jgi:hypothetical protein